MKDFTVNFNEQKNFILKYTIVDNTIVVSMADNSTITFPYSRKKEIELLSLMEKQYHDIDIESFQRKRNANLILVILISISYEIEIQKMIREDSNFFDYFIFIMFMLGILGNAFCLSYRQNLIQDYKKMTYFLDNREFFEKNYNLDINIIDGMSLTELESMLNGTSMKKIKQR